MIKLETENIDLCLQLICFNNQVALVLAMVMVLEHLLPPRLNLRLQ
jgi:hypothetical protein